MECLQHQSSIVLFTLISLMKRKEIPVNQILRENLLHLVDEKAPEVHMNPFTVFYRTKSAENSDKFGTINLNKTSMGVPGLKFILKQILSSVISQERIAAAQKLHAIIVHKERSQDRHVRRWIIIDNTAREERGGSLIYLAFHEDVQEAVVVGQEAGETGRENESETKATVNTSITGAIVNNPEVTISEAVVSRTEDTVTTGEFENREADPMEVEITVNTEATVNEGIPMEIEATVFQTTLAGTESTVEPTLSSEEDLRKTEDEKPSTVMKTKRKPMVLSKSVLNETDAEPIQGIFEKSFDSMKKHITAQIREVRIDYDNAGKFLYYTLHHPATDGHVNQIKFDKNFKNHQR
ncbi:hypothetical protein ACET3Z_010495 [Daucus carota]